MKLSDFQRIRDLHDRRETAITRHKYFTHVVRPHIQIGAVEASEMWAKFQPIATDWYRNEIEQIETELTDLGVEVEPHFKTDADGWLKPTSPLAEMLTARGYNLVGTGGNCKAWVRIMPDSEHVVISDLHGGSEPDINDWMVSRFRTEEWDDGHSQNSSDSERDFWGAVDHAEATPAYEG